MPKSIEEVRSYMKKYREDNKERIIETRIKYKSSPNRKKSYIIYNWKSRGIICDDYEALYNQYINVTNCDNCSIAFGSFGDGTGTHLCCDHDHKTGLFRNFLCNKCNLLRG